MRLFITLFLFSFFAHGAPFNEIPVGQYNSKSTSNTTYPEMVASLVNNRNIMFNENLYAVSSLCSATESDVWDAGGIRTNPSTPTVIELLSNNAADAAAGTGLRTLQVQGLDANYNYQEETVILNGTTPVNTVSQYIRINKIMGLSAGSGGKNAGIITARIVSAGATQATIPAGDNVSRLSQYTVPAGFTAYTLRGDGSAQKNIEMLFRWYVKPFGLLDMNVGVVRIIDAPIQINFNGSQITPEKSDIRVTCTREGAGTNAGATVQYSMLLIKN